MRKVVIGITGAVALLLAGMFASNAEAARLTGCCHINGYWMCGMACGDTGPSPAPRCCKLYGRWHCPCQMNSQNPRPDIYDPKTLAVMDQAFAAIWNTLRADDPFRDYANDSELTVTIGRKLLNLVADGVTDPRRLRDLTVDSLHLPGH